MFSFRRLHLVALIAVLAQQTAACQSSGSDFIDGGGPYCINTALSDAFSFGTVFTDCTASDAQSGMVTPILVDPNTNEYFCSDIADTPNGAVQVSTCNVAGNTVLKSSMISGTWTVVIEGLTFAYMRSFNILAGPQSTVTSTPTASFSVTLTPSLTVTTTSVFVVPTTLVPLTTTVPSSTRTIITTITPKPVTTTTTKFLTLTQIIPGFTTTIVTVTSTTACRTAAVRIDRINTLKLTKSAPGSRATKRARRSRFEAGGAWAPKFRRDAEPRDILQIRDADLCTTTVLATTNIPSTTFTITAPTTTIVISSVVTSTSTITPPVVTAYSGAATTTSTTTKPTQTLTLILQGITTKVVTIINTATFTSTKLVQPSSAACIQ